MRRLVVTLSVLVYLYSGYSLADEAYSMVDEAALAEHPQWLSLLHFDRGSLFGRSRSAVLDDGFFLAPTGKNDPLAELTATLARLRAPVVEGEPHASCRFPARALWLSHMIDEQWSEAECPEWEAWQQEHAGAEVGLMFASGYLGNPASFFGHLMLHLAQDSADQGMTFIRLLDTSLNFGADVPASDGLLTYMAKGLLGGYEAEYSRAPFYHNTSLYSEREMRDLWHYRLALPEEERKLLLAHIFEVTGQRFEYLFLTQNCASRIARTLELVVNDDLTPGHAPWVAPETLVRAIGKAEVAGRPLLAGTRHVPSRRLQTEWRYQALSIDEQAVARAVWPKVGTLNLQAESYHDLAPERQAAVVDTLLSHAAFLMQTGDESGLAEINRQLLQARLQLPAGTDSLKIDNQVPLHEVTSPALIRLTAVHNNEIGNVFSLTLRFLQYDLMDSNSTRMPNAALEIGRTELDFDHGGVRLRQLELFHVTNLHARNVHLPALSNVVWHTSAGIERSRFDCADCLDSYAVLLAGKSYQFSHYLPFFMGGLQLRSENHKDGYLAPLVQLGMLGNWTSNQRSLLQLVHTDSLKGDAGRRTRWLLQHRVALGDNLDLRIGLEGDDHACEMRFGFSRYF
ncbi:protein of unknown function [Ectothiorhodospira magna]|uniref:Uncharacterized protein n=1 Tax=Ectothiorhodospira magna TaxID=867345 RepID=A0A1H9C7L2_9GAMM|nr:DUF4105 domain-containing protein [Ectothiorhodospira magna]SEP96947.1 protein of unknown function [Ectothiorhodospira magna]